MLPYSLEIYFSVIARMNGELGIFVVLGVLLALFLLAITWWPVLADHKDPRVVDTRAGLAIAAGWVASGAVFYGNYLEPMFFAAPWLMAGFMIQGLILATLALVHPVRARDDVGAAVWTGRALMLGALAAMPLADLLAGPGWPAVRFVGLAPEPTVLFTCGWLLTRHTDWRLVALAVVPAMAGALAAYSAIALAWPPDWVVALAALTTLLYASGAAFTRARAAGGRS